jgi:hypothetical protein
MQQGQRTFGRTSLESTVDQVLSRQAEIVNEQDKMQSRVHCCLRIVNEEGTLIRESEMGSVTWPLLAVSQSQRLHLDFASLLHKTSFNFQSYLEALQLHGFSLDFVTNSHYRV